MSADADVGKLALTFGLIVGFMGVEVAASVIAHSLVLVLVGVSVSLGNFAAAIGIGVSGAQWRTMLRVGLVFGVCETGMPIIGLLIGAQLASSLGRVGRWVGAALLAAIGCYNVIQSLRDRKRSDLPTLGLAKLALTGVALGFDNLVAGFALGTYGVPVAAAAMIIGGVSVALSMIGLKLGSSLGKWMGNRAEIAGGVVLVVVGGLIAGGMLS